MRTGNFATPCSASKSPRPPVTGLHHLSILLHPLQQLIRFGDGLALDCLRHHGGGRLTDGAPLPAEPDVLDGAVFDEKVQGNLIAAQRIVQLHRRCSLRQLPLVLRTPISVSVLNLW